jgi:hypothetical protein
MATPPDFTTGAVLTAAQMNAVGMWLVDTETVTTASQAILDGCFTTDYTNYRIVITASGSTTGEILMELRNAGANKTATEYVVTGLDRNAGALSTFGSNTKRANLYVSNVSASTNLTFATIDIFRPKDTFRTGLLWNTGFEWTSNDMFYRSGMGYFDVTDSCDGFRIYPNAGTFDATVRVYGYNN